MASWLPAPAAGVTVAEIDAMRSDAEQHGLAAFLATAAANQWQAPAIPSTAEYFP